MALSASTVIEVRTTGSDNNGGGFVTGASGTDFSQQTSAQFALTGLTTIAANAIILTSSAAATMVGNLINITGGTNFITGIYQITAVSAGVSITVDRNCTSAAGATGTANIGGCFATIGKALAQMTVTGMISYVKATATYSISTGLSTPSGVSTSAGIARVIGYTTSRGDNGQATIQSSTTAITMLSDSIGGFRFENLIIDGNSQSTVVGINFTGAGTSIYNSLIKNCPGSNQGNTITGAGCVMLKCEVTSCGSGGGTGGNGAVWTNNGGITFSSCFIHNNTAPAITINDGYCIIESCVIANNTGATSAGIVTGNNNNNTIKNNVLYANGSNGIKNFGNYSTSEITNNIFVNNGAFGINIGSNTPFPTDVLINYNAYFNNTSGATNGVNAGPNDVTLTGVPFVNAGSNNFALNNTSGQGAACRAAGFPGIVPVVGTGYVDIGALQVQSNALIQQDMTGGCRG